MSQTDFFVEVDIITGGSRGNTNKLNNNNNKCHTHTNQFISHF